MSDTSTPEPPLHMPYRRLWRDWLSPHRRLLFIAIFMALVAATASGAYSKFIQLLMTGLETGDSSVKWWGPIGVICLTSLSGTAMYLRVTLTNRAVFRMETELRKSMFSGLVGADLAQLQREPPAALAARFSSDIQLAGTSVRSIVSALTSIATFVVTIGFMLSIDATLTLAMVTILALAFIPINIIGRHLRRLAKRTQAEIANMMSEVVEGLSGIRMARTYRLEKPLSESADRQFERLFGLRVKQNQWQARIAPLMEILMGIAVGVLLLVVARRIEAGTTTIADFTGLLTGIGVMTGPARTLGGTFASAMQGRAALDRIFGLFDIENRIVGGTGTMERARGHITFEDVSFSYPDGHVALDNITLDVKPGSKTAFVGRSGAGKSTIFNLLPRLYDPVSGAIRIDGTDTRELTLASLRDQIAVVSQESVLLTGTVAENIGFGRRDASREQIEAAARAAAADGFIRDLANGYDTRIIPSESSFSGGERQRLSIARAILRNAPILLLDEATSALDAESETQIQHALDRLTEGRTTLVIAHRLATIMNCDQIVVLDRGRVVETGSHDQLVASGGVYSELHRLQFAGS